MIYTFKFLSKLLAIVGAFLVANYIGVYILGTYTIEYTPYFSFANSFILSSKLFGYHFLGLSGCILILISSLLNKKINSVLSDKQRALLFDLLVMFGFYFLLSSILYKSQLEESTINDFQIIDFYKSKVLYFLCFIFIYYVFFETTGGTWGKQVFIKKDKTSEKKKALIFPIFLNGIIYTFPLIVINIYINYFISSIYLIADTDFYKAYSLFSFIYYFVLIGTIVSDILPLNVVSKITSRKEKVNL